MKTIRPYTLAGTVAVLFLIACSRALAGTESNSTVFAWGELQQGIKMGLHVEKGGGGTTNLYSFTIVLLNCGTNTVRVPFGNTWDGPVCPLLVVGDGRGFDWRVSPPMVKALGPAITHIPKPNIVDLMPGKVTQIHTSLFVPPVSPGEWSVYAWVQPTLGPRAFAADGDRCWKGPPLASGKVPITVQR